MKSGVVFWLANNWIVTGVWMVGSDIDSRSDAEMEKDSGGTTSHEWKVVKAKKRMKICQAISHSDSDKENFLDRGRKKV